LLEVQNLEKQTATRDCHPERSEGSLFVFLEGVDPRCFAPLNMTARKASTLLEIQAFSIAWNLEFEAYLEFEVRDLPVRIRGSSSSLCLGFPSASTPVPV